MRYGYNDILVLPQDLQDFAWSAPMRDLAPQVGLSDVGLKKALKSYGIVTPPQGHWNRAHAGRPVSSCPKVAERGPGQRGRLLVDPRFARVINSAEPLSSAGPFATANVPEDLEALRAEELRAIGRAVVPRRLERVHHGLTQIFRQEERRREKFAQSDWAWDKPKFDTPVDRRRLRMLNAIFMTLSRRGHAASAYERDGVIDATAIVGDTRIGIEIDLVGQRRERRGAGWVPTSTDLPAGTPLALTVDRGGDGQGGTGWQDDRDGTIESRLAAIVAGIIVAGETAFRRGLKEAEVRAEQFRAWEEQQRRERAEARNQERLRRLRESGELLRQAEDLRALLVRVGDAVAAGSLAVDPAVLKAWSQWAGQEADRLDPVLSGQFMTHLLPAGEGD